ncbi:unnamed protein product, partial [Citrullus colocynthis]
IHVVLLLLQYATVLRLAQHHLYRVIIAPICIVLSKAPPSHVLIHVTLLRFESQIWRYQ